MKKAKRVLLTQMEMVSPCQSQYLESYQLSLIIKCIDIETVRRQNNQTYTDRICKQTKKNNNRRYVQFSTVDIFVISQDIARSRQFTSFICTSKLAIQNIRIGNRICYSLEDLVQMCNIVHLKNICKVFQNFRLPHSRKSLHLSTIQKIKDVLYIKTVSPESDLFFFINKNYKKNKPSFF